MVKHSLTGTVIILALALAAGGPAFAKKSDSPGNSGAQKSSQEDSVDATPHHDVSKNSHAYFNKDRRNLIRNYYSNPKTAKNCPPGLAKKNNGCQPPGQAKKWRKGESLPRDMVYNDVPRALIDQLGHTPEGNKLVQVDSDLLLINTATGVILDAFLIQE